MTHARTHARTHAHGANYDLPPASRAGDKKIFHRMALIKYFISFIISTDPISMESQFY